MRKIDSVIIHCSATKAGMDFSVADIDRWHRARGMNGIGYHYVVRLDGTVEKGRVEVAVSDCDGDGPPGYFAGFEWEWDYRTG